MFACNLANQAKNCNKSWHCIKTMPLIIVRYACLASVGCCLLLPKTSHLLCCFYPVIFHIKHLKTFEQDVLCWRGHGRRERWLPGPRRKAAQILNGQLQSKAGLSVSKQILSETNRPTSLLMLAGRLMGLTSASATPLTSIQAKVYCHIMFITMFTSQICESRSDRGNYMV